MRCGKPEPQNVSWSGDNQSREISGISGGRGGAFGETVNLTLTNVIPYNAKEIAAKITGRSPETNGFSLTFEADGQLPASGIPTLSHPVLGTFDLFLTKGSGLSYEAVVNHIV